VTKIQKIILDHYKSFCDSETALKIMSNHKNNFKIFLSVVEKRLESRKPKGERNASEEARV
jgi:hypothetical protein